VGAKALLRARGNLTYGAMMLLGWSALTLVAANSHLGEALGHALVDGQLYFAGPAELLAALGLAALAGLTLPWLAPRLLRARIFPRHDRANRLPAWRWHLGFDALLAFGAATATATLGLMGAFALVLLPAWIAFRLAPSWGSALGLASLIGGGAHLGAFALALWLDQPFGPVLVLVLLGLAGLGLAGPGAPEGSSPGTAAGRPAPSIPPF
jgi:zinc transport system permease protein